MAEKTLSTRIIHKHDVESNWLLATNFTPKQGELIVYDIDSNYSYERFKIGDGIQNVNKLPFVMVQSDLSVNNEADPAYIKNRTHWSEGLTTVEWDGNTDGLPASSNNTNYKVSNLKPNASEIIGGKLVFSNGSVVEITSDMIETGGYIYSVYYGTIYVNTSNGSAYSAAIGVTLPEPGIYFQKNSYNQIVSFSYGNETIHTLDEKYIPDTIARVSDISEGITVDDTLSISGQAADAKAVGDAVNNLSTLVGDTSVSEQISSAVADKADISAGTYVATATSKDGIAYVVDVPGITALTAGVSFTLIPGVKSDSIAPTLNVNGLGAKGLRRRLSANAMSLQKGSTASWLPKGKPFRVVYDGSNWVVEDQNKPMASDLYGYFTSVLVKDRINGYGYILEMQNGQLVSSSCCESISVTTLPTKTEYVNGESFDVTGMVVTATCEDGSTKIINNAMCECNPTMAVGEVTVVVYYTECNVEYTDSFVINVT